MDCQVLFDYLATPAAPQEDFKEIGICIPETVIIRKRRATAILRFFFAPSLSLSLSLSLFLTLSLSL